MKILFLIEALNGGGAERVLLHILRYLNKTKFEIYLGLGVMTGEYTDDIPKHINVIDMSSFYGSISVYYNFNQILINHNIRLVVSFMTKANLIALRTKFFFNRKLKVIVTEHNNPKKNYLSSKVRIKNIMKKIDLYFFYKYSNKIVTVSRGIENELISQIKVSKKIITTIYNPIDIEYVNTMKKSKPKIFNHKSNFKYIIAVGRLVEQKGYLDMLNIIKELNQKIAVKLIILGEGRLRAKIKNYIDNNGLKDMVILVGFVNNPWSFINHSDVYLSTSKWEGFHMTIVESMACGVYPIVSNCDYGPNEIILNKSFGKLINVGDNKRFVDELYHYLSHHKKGYKHEICINRAYDFDVHKIVNQYSKLFDSILN